MPGKCRPSLRAKTLENVMCSNLSITDKECIKAAFERCESPTIEAEPVRHGRWVIEKRHAVSRNPYMDDNYFASATCSECGFCIHAETKSFGYPDLNTTNFCPNCGARMDGDSNDEG